MRQHTPGPWIAPSAGLYTARGAMLATAGTAACVRSQRKHGISDSEALANVRLMAAAPELYELCKSMMGTLYSIFNPGAMPEDAKTARRLIEELENAG